MSMKVNGGVLDLLANANSKTSYEGKKFFFEGDLNQMSIARAVANKLGISTDITGGLPFVKSEEDFDRVTQYIVENKLEGWWHYSS